MNIVEATFMTAAIFSILVVLPIVLGIGSVISVLIYFSRHWREFTDG